MTSRPPVRHVVRPWPLAGHMVSHATALVPLGVATLVLGMSLYHWVEGSSLG